MCETRAARARFRTLSRLTKPDKHDPETLRKIAQCAAVRVSCALPDNRELFTVPRDLELCERLAGADPKHLSPFEHQATPHSSEPRRG